MWPAGLHQPREAGVIAAIGRAQAVIAFNLDGTIIYGKRKLPENARLFTWLAPGQTSRHLDSGELQPDH
jgi:hypothetical protein